MSQDLEAIEELFEDFLVNLADMTSIEKEFEIAQKQGADFHERLSDTETKLVQLSLALEMENINEYEYQDYKDLLVALMDLQALGIMTGYNDREIITAAPGGLRNQDTVDFFEKKGAKNAVSLLKKIM